MAYIFLTRRRGKHQVASVLTAGVLGLVLPALSSQAADSSSAWAAGLKNLTPEQGETLLMLGHDLFPHDEIPDAKLTTCIDPVDAAAGDPQAKQSLDDALGIVEGAARRMGYKTYTEISDEDERERLAKMLAEGRWMRQFKKSLEACLKADQK